MSVKLERKTVAAMVQLFCRAHHRGRGLCNSCRELLEYADARLEKCPFADGKPTCRVCSIHCYRKDMKERITEVMRFAGPRMILHHPILALRHLLQERTRRGKTTR